MKGLAVGRGLVGWGKASGLSRLKIRVSALQKSWIFREVASTRQNLSSPPTEGCPFAFAKRSEEKRSAGKGGVGPLLGAIRYA